MHGIANSHYLDSNTLLGSAQEVLLDVYSDTIEVIDSQ